MKYEKKLVLFTLFAMNLVDQPAPEVTIEQGTLSGKISSDGTFLEYIGIPYATTDITTRFQPPLPPPTWEGVYKATEESICPQYLPTPFNVIGTEDCLKVNVYVPTLTKKPLPVMVFIHGGGFLLGSGGKLLHRPDLLVDQDVILVTFNYRLGVLGFLCLGIKEAPGNVGLRDQIAALKWVKKNIAAFGGDPDNITIFGESAGGTSIGLLLASKAADGLYNKAILQSGAASMIWALNRNPLLTAKHTVEAFGHKTEDPYEIYEILSKIPYNDLVGTKPSEILHLFFNPEKLHLPCIEKPIDGIEPVLTDLPYNLIKNKSFNIPIIYGSNNREGLFLMSTSFTEIPYEDRKEKILIGSDLEWKSEKEKLYVTENIKEFYFGAKSKTNDSFTNTVDLYTHLFFEMPVILESELILENTNSSLYNYYFKYSGGRNLLKTLTGHTGEPGACHADELTYLFKAYLWPYDIREEDQDMVDWMTKMWTNFAKYGDPTPQSSDDLSVKWLPSSKYGLKFLNIDKELVMSSIPNPEAYQLWKDIYSKYRKTHLEM